GAHCTPKGRALANFHVLQDNSGLITLVLPRDQLENTTNGLNKYAPFFRVSLKNGPTRTVGLAGPRAQSLCQQVMGTTPQETGQVSHSERGSVLCLDQNRLLLLIAPEQLQAIREELAKDARSADPELWELMNIRAGVGYIRAATCEEFIPQMLNMQVSHGKNGAISFKKGCYTGQEVVARMHYLGKLKRRMYRLQIPHTEINTGDHCYLPGQPQSQGNIVSVARCDKDAMELLAVLTEKAAASEQLAIGANPDSAHPVAAKQLPLPYSLDS
ncbi:MAG: hypothetical protein OIF34_04775, partial [Porticoccaceae bacterium]|nr:hypothetical protein [Porticoccaceae bacterium]